MKVYIFYLEYTFLFAICWVMARSDDSCTCKHLLLVYMVRRVHRAFVQNFKVIYYRICRIRYGPCMLITIICQVQTFVTAYTCSCAIICHLSCRKHQACKDGFSRLVYLASTPIFAYLASKYLCKQHYFAIRLALSRRDGWQIIAQGNDF